jgi:hypothetical protein
MNWSARAVHAVQSPALALLAVLAAVAGQAALPASPARAQAGVEAAKLTEQSTRPLFGNPNHVGPAWSTGKPDGPAIRFKVARGQWWGSPGAVGGAVPLDAYRDRAGVGGGEGEGALPARRPRPRSGKPGLVAGLVCEAGTRLPGANVTLTLTSTEPEYTVETLTARTDSAGYYEFRDVEPGAWAITVVADRLNPRWAPPRVGRLVTVAPRDSVAAPAIELHRVACVAGKAVWSDGYVLFDAPFTVAPLDTTQWTTTGLLNGVGDYRTCAAPDDSVMVWMHLRDGRSLGRAVRLSAAAPREVDFRPDPIEKMEGCTVRILPVLNDGRPVPRARVTIVGRRHEQGPRPALVFVREEAADADGVVEVRVPFGNYELLVTNPNGGQVGKVWPMVVNTNQGVAPLRIELRGQSTPGEQDAMRNTLLDRAETYMYVWNQ